MKNGAIILRNWLQVSKERARTLFSEGDLLLLFTVLGMVFFGLLMVYSSSFIYAQERTGDGFAFIEKQLLFAAAGVLLLFISSQIQYHLWMKLSLPLLIFSTLLLALVLVPGVGVRVGGAQRWIHLGFFSFQPGELMKFAIIVFVSQQLARKKDRIQEFHIKHFSHFVFLVPPLGMLLLQPDFGSTVICMLSIFVLLFLGGIPFRYLAGVLLAAGISAVALIFSSPYRLARLNTYIDPWQDPTGRGFQILQSLVGLSNGRALGVGLGNGKEKLFFLPEAHNDFIFAVIGEELGFLGAVCVLLAFCFFIYRGLRAGWNVYHKKGDAFGLYLAGGITVSLGLQALINMAVVFGLLPTKGLTLPFISYGGSALMVNLFAVGVVMSVSRSRVGSKHVP